MQLHTPLHRFVHALHKSSIRGFVEPVNSLCKEMLNKAHARVAVRVVRGGVIASPSAPLLSGAGFSGRFLCRICHLGHWDARISLPGKPLHLRAAPLSVHNGRVLWRHHDTSAAARGTLGRPGRLGPPTSSVGRMHRVMPVTYDRERSCFAATSAHVPAVVR